MFQPYQNQLPPQDLVLLEAGEVQHQVVVVQAQAQAQARVQNQAQAHAHALSLRHASGAEGRAAAGQVQVGSNDRYLRLQTKPRLRKLNEKSFCFYRNVGGVYFGAGFNIWFAF